MVVLTFGTPPAPAFDCRRPDAPAGYGELQLLLADAGFQVIPAVAYRRYSASCPVSLHIFKNSSEAVH